MREHVHQQQHGSCAASSSKLLTCSARQHLACGLPHSLRLAGLRLNHSVRQRGKQRPLPVQAVLSTVAVPSPSPSSSSGVGPELGWPQNFEERYQLCRLIGQGSFGVVYEGFDGESGALCAVKVLGKERKNWTRRKTLRRLQREVALLSACSGMDNVAHLQAVYEKDNYCYLVLECVRGGNLEQLVTKQGSLSEAQSACLAYEILKVLQDCHEHPSLPLVHGDVKPANFMLTRDFDDLNLTYVRRQTGARVLKVVDFGCSQVLRPEKDHMLTKRSGTPVFMAPDVWSKYYSTPADMWSLGMTLYFLLSGRLPFWPSLKAVKGCNIEQVRDAVCCAPVPFEGAPWNKVSPDCIDLVRRLLDRDPAARPSAREALEHGWFYRFSL